MALTGSAKFNLDFTHTKTGDGQSAYNVINHALTLQFTDGVAAGNANRIWQDTRTLSASASETIDLSGVLEDLFGDSAVFADVRLVAVTALSTNTNNVNVLRGTTSPETGLPLFLASGDGIPVRPGGAFLWMCPDATGIPVTATTADKITFTNSAGSTDVTYTVTVVGANA